VHADQNRRALYSLGQIKVAQELEPVMLGELNVRSGSNFKILRHCLPTCDEDHGYDRRYA